MKYYILFVFLTLLVNSIRAEDNCGCNVNFYIEDPDSSGTNLRDAPKGKVITRIKFAKETFNAVHVTEFKDGWFKVDTVTFESGVVKNYPNAWIHSSVVKTGFDDGEFKEGKNGTYIQTTPIYSSPTYKAKSGETFSKNGKISVTGCKGMWLKVNYTIDKRNIEGWWAPEDQCANPLTNCVNNNDGETKGVDLWGNR